MTTEQLNGKQQVATRSKQRWLNGAYAKARGKSPERAARFETHSQFEVQPLYTPDDLDVQGFDYERDLGYPGEFPYTRGVQPTMYRGRLWTMRQYAGFGDASESNRRYRYLLQQGQTGLSVAFDLPTQMGYDSDAAMADGEVGKVGVAISSFDDMENLLRDIPLDKVSTSMTINATASVLLALYIAVARQQGVPETALNGTVQNDILKEYMARGTYIYPPAPSLRLITDLMAYCRDHVPNWNTISISGYHIREAGATAVQEVAFTIADALAYVQAALDAGLKIDEFAPRLAFFFNSHNDFLEEVAKFRAARRLWARLMQERYQPQDPRSLMLRFHTQTAGSTLTAQQPANNIVRTTVQAMAAVLGGTQSLHTNSMDEALALPSEEAARTALRTQQILAYESGVASTIDPLAGSYYIESLTAAIEQGAREYLDKVEQLGGTLKALEGGFFQAEIQESAYRWQREVEGKQRIIVGVNQFEVDEPPPANLLRINERVQREQIARLQTIRAHRDNSLASEQRAMLRRAAAGRDNLMPHIIACVEARVTLGEICDTLREVFGEYRETVF